MLLSACAAQTPVAVPNATPAPTAAPTASSAFEPQQYIIDQDLSIRAVAPGVYVITHAFPWPGNSMLVEMSSSDLVLVDTPYTPEATAQVLEWAREELGERSLTAVVTGYHYDNLGGSSYLVEQGIPLYGSSETAKLLEERGDDLRALTMEWLQGSQNRRFREVHEKLPYAPPDHLFELEQGLELAFDGETVQVYYPGPTHAPDNVVVYFPARKLLFGGCMIIGGGSVGNVSDANLTAWPESVRKLVQFDVTMLVPGHGDRLDPQLIQNTIDLLAEFSVEK
jgi:glyoxylase-like metal-dependent hydrolase (beta-lactamase superfamily II)